MYKMKVEPHHHLQCCGASSFMIYPIHQRTGYRSIPAYVGIVQISAKTDHSCRQALIHDTNRPKAIRPGTGITESKFIGDSQPIIHIKGRCTFMNGVVRGIPLFRRFLRISTHEHHANQQQDLF